MCVFFFHQLEWKQKWIKRKTAEIEAGIKLQTSDDLNKLANELIKAKKEANDLEKEMAAGASDKVLSLEYERDVFQAELIRLLEENLELKNKNLLQTAERILSSFSESSQLYAQVCVAYGFDYSLRPIHTQVGGKNLLRVGIIEAHRSQNLLPVNQR